MKWPTAFCVTGCIAAYLAFLAHGASASRQAESEIATACLQAGGQWITPNWYSGKECQR